MSETNEFRSNRLPLFMVVVLAMGLAVGTAWHFSRKSQANAGEIRPLDHTNFSAGIASGIHLVDFWAEWCGPCKLQDPALRKVSSMYAGRVVISKVNVDHSPELAEQLNIRSIPTLLLFRNGRLVNRLEGLQSEQDLVSALNGALR